MNPNKKKATRECPIPTTLDKIRGNLGLIGYYHRFFKIYGQTTTPLTKLFKKEPFTWTKYGSKNFE